MESNKVKTFVTGGTGLLGSNIVEKLSKITGERALVDPANNKRMNRDFWFSSSKAEEELGIGFRPLAETMSDTVQWFQTENLV